MIQVTTQSTIICDTEEEYNTAIEYFSQQLGTTLTLEDPANYTIKVTITGEVTSFI